MKIQENVSLTPFTTFRIGGPARFFARAESVTDIQEAIEFAEGKNPTGKALKVFVLGGGSNVLVSDAGFDGLVIKNEICGIVEENAGNDVDGLDCTRIMAGAGEDWDSFVKYVVQEKGLHGLENLSYIPGTVGASPVQNIGAYGVEAKDTIEWVEVFDPKTKEVEKISNADCRFGYRDSIFKHERKNNIILRVAFLLTKNDKLSIDYKDLQKYFDEKAAVPSLCGVRDAVIQIRKNKLPDISKIGTAGSFFKNPIISKNDYQKLLEKYPGLPSFLAGGENVKVPVAWILDNICGFKGVRQGEVGVYQNQALVLVNLGKGTADDVKKLAAQMIDDVKEKTGITILPEDEFIG